jgi:hypothetical protein
MSPTPRNQPEKLDHRRVEDIDMERGIARTKALQQKFAKALDNPDTRAAMARYIQGLLRDEKP